MFQLSLTEADKKILSAYGVKTYSELFSPPDPRPWYPAWGIPRDEPQQLFETKKGDLQRKYLSKLVLSSPDKFENIWTEYTNELNKLDVKGYEQWFTQKIQEVIAQAQGQ